jgi:hypothetical protein
MNLTMATPMKNLIRISALLLALSAGYSVQAQVSLTTAGYTQNFSSMGTGTTAPTGWSGVSEAGSHYTFVPVGSGDYNPSSGVNPNFTAGALTATTVVYETPAQGSSTGKGTTLINWSNPLATIGNGEGSESLGTDPSGNAATIIELSLTNNTGSALSGLNLSYDIDRFTTISNTNGIPTGYPNTGVEELPGYELFYNLTPSNADTWVNVSSLNPTINMGTTGPVQVPNTVGITTVPLTYVSFGGSTVATGQTISFAWFDDNAESPSPDQEIGLNNVVIAVAPEPSSLALCLAGAALLAFLFRRRIA